MNTEGVAELEDLALLRDWFYRRAEVRWQLSLLLAVGTLAVTTVGLWIDAPLLVGCAGLIALLLPIGVAWLREAAADAQLRGDKCRRLVLEAQGLGRSVPTAEISEVRAWSVGQALRPTEEQGAPYFLVGDALRPGPQRLSDMVAESSFFTEFLADKLQGWLKLSFAVCLLVAIAALFLLDLASAMDRAAILLVAKSVAVFIAFLISGDFLLLAKKFADLRSAAHRAHQKFDRFRQQADTPVEEVLAAVQDYGVAVVQAPPIPSWLYSLYRDELNRVYSKSRAA